ncbi:hypothetical protein CVT24_005254 [Panaeolus cyanescens]|uniref:BSD domain-containing protein n=1 Tax=Panaeolus cyanescens TaxID=181874 RepID=A0A409Y8Z2_9AGAR|nr:hypothetical protein CVT24_005254 [Panaeolus cyanescens]
MPTTVCTAKASCKKLPGLLELTNTHLQWTQDGNKAPSIRVPYADASSLFCSKEGAAQVKLKLGLVGDDAEHYFTFTSMPQTLALAEREKFKQELTAIIGRNRGVIDSPQKPGPTPIKSSTSLPVTASGTTGAQRTGLALGRPSVSRATSVSSDRRATPVITGADPASEFALRKKVLLANPELGALHKDLVMTGQITEAEFWDGREHLILAQAAAENQKKGKPGQIVDPRPETVEGGEIKILITPQLVLDIFDEYPIVKKAYSENVPSKLSQAEFWKRYFQSKLFHAHRASIRSSAAQHVVKDDPIFDKYLEKDDDELEPRKPRNENVTAFVDLLATMEDHGETGNEKDITMQAGRQKAALPLIRKFNEHSERLLNSALGDIPAAKRRRLDHGEDGLAEIVIDDLQDPESSDGIPLDMQDRQRYFEGRMAGVGGSNSDPSKPHDPKLALQALRAGVQGWDARLAELKVERKPGDSAFVYMTQNVMNRLNVRSQKNDIPPGVFKDMIACQTATDEFLRQFWSAVYPPLGDLQVASQATPAQRAAKAARMIGYISATPEKVQKLIRAGEMHGCPPKKIETAMKPVLDAVNQAIKFHKMKTGGKA